MENTYDIDKYGGRDGLLKIGRKALSSFDFDKYGDISNFLSDYTKDEGTVNREGLNSSTYNLIKQLLPEGEELGIKTKEQIEGLVKTYYFLGEYLVDLYVGFADHIHQKFLELQKGNKEVKVIFDGRDSLGFFNVYCKRYGNKDVMFSRSNRGCVMGYSSGTNNKEIKKEEDEAVINFYRRKNLLDRTLLFVDSGFNGTLPRLHQAILQNNEITPPDINIELFTYYDNHQNIDEMISENFNNQETINNDKLNKEKISGYTNKLLNIDGEQLKKLDPFRKTIQELSAYIKEARTDGLLDYHERNQKDKKTDFTLDSIQNLTAKYNFMKGLNSVNLKNYETSEKEIANRIKGFKILYSQYDIFSNLEDFTEKRILDKRVEELSDSIYTLLSVNNLRDAVG